MNPPKNDDSTAERTRDFERWRRAVEIVRLMREAGFDCELDRKPAQLTLRQADFKAQWLS